MQRLVKMPEFNKACDSSVVSCRISFATNSKWWEFFYYEVCTKN